MKITKLYIKDHPFFGTKEIDFTASTGEPLSTVVLAGINGSGKTTLLEYIRKLLHKGIIQHNEYSTISNVENFDHIQLAFTELEARIIRMMRKQYSDDSQATIAYGLENYNPFSDYIQSEKLPETVLPGVTQKQEVLKLLPKCIFLPSETHFNDIEITLQPYIYHYDFFHTIDKHVAKYIPDYFATFIDQRVYQNENVPAKESIENACAEINAIFKTLALESRLIGLKKDGSRMPMFRNKSGKEFDIQGLSSGEKQLFFRIMALKMFQVNHSILLIDEPEISLHPAWQQKILKIYENIGIDNQVIVATHSPHIIASTPKENVKLFTYDEETKTFHVIGYTNISATKGVPIERILQDVMGLPTTRDPEVQEEIDQLWEWIYQGNFERPDFKRQYDELEQLLGTIDEDLLLMKMEIGKKKWEKEQQHAQS